MHVAGLTCAASWLESLYNVVDVLELIRLGHFNVLLDIVCLRAAIFEIGFILTSAEILMVISQIISVTWFADVTKSLIEKI